MIKKSIVKNESKTFNKFLETYGFVPVQTVDAGAWLLQNGFFGMPCRAGKYLVFAKKNGASVRYAVQRNNALYVADMFSGGFLYVFADELLALQEAGKPCR